MWENSLIKNLRGWLNGDFYPGLNIQLGIPSWEKMQVYEKFQRGLKYNSFEKNLEFKFKT